MVSCHRMQKCTLIITTERDNWSKEKAEVLKIDRRLPPVCKVCLICLVRIKQSFIVYLSKVAKERQFHWYECKVLVRSMGADSRAFVQVCWAMLEQVEQGSFPSPHLLTAGVPCSGNRLHQLLQGDHWNQVEEATQKRRVLRKTCHHQHCTEEELPQGAHVSQHSNLQQTQWLTSVSNANLCIIYLLHFRSLQLKALPSIFLFSICLYHYPRITWSLTEPACAYWRENLGHAWYKSCHSLFLYETAILSAQLP